MADTKTGVSISGPLSSFLTEQEISELPLAGEKIAKAYRASSPFFKLPLQVNPEAEIVEFFETHCVPSGRQTLYVRWWQGSVEHHTRYKVDFGPAPAGGCKKVKISRAEVPQSTADKYGDFMTQDRFYLSGYRGKKATKNRRFEAQLIKNYRGELVEIIVFQERRVRTSFGRALQGLTGGPKNPGWDGKTVFQYNFVLGLGYLH